MISSSQAVTQTRCRRPSDFTETKTISKHITNRDRITQYYLVGCFCTNFHPRRLKNVSSTVLYCS